MGRSIRFGDFLHFTVQEVVRYVELIMEPDDCLDCPVVRSVTT